MAPHATSSGGLLSAVPPSAIPLCLVRWTFRRLPGPGARPTIFTVVFPLLFLASRSSVFRDYCTGGSVPYNTYVHILRGSYNPSVGHLGFSIISLWCHHELTTDGPLYQLHVLKMIFPCGRVLVSSIFGYTRPRHQQHCLSYGRMLIFAPCLVFSWYRTCSCTCRTERTQRYVAISLRSFRIRMLGTVPLPYQVYQAYVPALRID